MKIAFALVEPWQGIVFTVIVWKIELRPMGAPPVIMVATVRAVKLVVGTATTAAAAAVIAALEVLCCCAPLGSARHRRRTFLHMRQSEIVQESDPAWPQ